MANKPNVQNRWWVETAVKKPKQGQTDKSLPKLPVAMGFYSVARDYDQEVAKEHLTDNNLRIIREVDPPQGGWAYLAMTEERYPERLINRVKNEFRIPREARGIVLDHGRLVRLLICGPQLEDWSIDITLTEEPSVDVYVWGTMQRERLFKNAEEALRQSRLWAMNLLHYPPARDEPFRGSVL